MILTGAFAMLIGSILFGLTGIGGVILVAGVFLVTGRRVGLVERAGRRAARSLGSRARRQRSGQRELGC